MRARVIIRRNLCTQFVRDSNNSIAIYVVARVSNPQMMRRKKALACARACNSACAELKCSRILLHYYLIINRQTKNTLYTSTAFNISLYERPCAD